MGFFITNRYTVGLDLQADEIRLVKMEATRYGKKIRVANRFPLPANGLMVGQIHEQKILFDFLKSVTRGLNKFPTAIALPGYHVIRKDIEVPKKLTVEEVREFTNYQLQNLFLDRIDSLCFDYYKIENNENVSDRVHIVATPISIRNNYIDLARYCGLNLRVLDIEDYALARSVTQNAPQHVIGIIMVENEFQILICNSNKILIQQRFSDAKEIMTRIQLIQEKYSPIEYVLTGNTQKISSIEKFLHIPFKFYYPATLVSDGMSLDGLKKHAPAFAVAVGLASRNFPRC